MKISLCSRLHSTITACLLCPNSVLLSLYSCNMLQSEAMIPQLVSPIFEAIGSYTVGLTHVSLLQFLIMLICTVLLCVDVSVSYPIQVPVRLIQSLEYRKTGLSVICYICTKLCPSLFQVSHSSWPNCNSFLIMQSVSVSHSCSVRTGTFVLNNGTRIFNR